MIDLYTDFMNVTTRKEKIYFFCSVTTHGFLQFCDMGFAFYFMTPNLLCKQNQQEDFHKCSYVDACSSQFGYKIDDSSPNNLSRQFGLVCEREYLKLLCTQIILAMGSLGTIFLLFVKIKDNRQFYINLLILHLVCLVLFQFQSNVIMSALCLGFAFNFSNSLFYTNLWIYSKQVLSKESFQLLSAYDGLGYSIVGIIIPITLFMMNSNIYLIMCIVCFIQSSLFCLYLQTFQQNVPVHQCVILEQKQQQSAVSILKQSPHLIFIIIVFSQDFLMYIVTVNFILIELQSFGGIIYLNMGCYELCGILSNLCALQFLKHQNVRKSKTYVQATMGLIQLLFIFKSGGSQHPIFIFFMLCFKLLGDIMFALNMKILFDFLPIDVVQFFFAFNVLQYRTLLIFQPSVSIYIQKQGIHPLFVYGLYTLLLVYLQQYMKPLDFVDNQNEDANEQQSVFEQIQMLTQSNQSIMVQNLSSNFDDTKDNTLLRNTSLRMSKKNFQLGTISKFDNLQSN